MPITSPMDGHAMLCLSYVDFIFNCAFLLRRIENKQIENQQTNSKAVASQFPEGIIAAFQSYCSALHTKLT